MPISLCHNSTSFKNYVSHETGLVKKSNYILYRHLVQSKLLLLKFVEHYNTAMICIMCVDLGGVVSFHDSLVAIGHIPPTVLRRQTLTRQSILHSPYMPHPSPLPQSCISQQLSLYTLTNHACTHYNRTRCSHLFLRYCILAR